MKKYSCDQFKPNEAWVVFRVDIEAEDQPQPVDIYILMDVFSSYVFGQVFASGELPDSEEVGNLMKHAFSMKNNWPRIFFFPKLDPAEQIFKAYCKKQGIPFKVEPLVCFENIIAHFKKSFSENFYSPMSMPQILVPDSYDPCWCASGLKFKFCCKRIFKEISSAMIAADDGNFEEALEWMEKAESKVGQTAETLCRYAVVFSFFDQSKSDEYLKRCLEKSPIHPRANYIMAINLNEKGDLNGAVKAYKKAIENYPKTDTYHLCEAWNNLGVTYYNMENYAEAKNAWETALLYLPEDEMAMNNLNDLIYDNPTVPDAVKGSQTIH